jgi:hypothetical protein
MEGSAITASNAVRGKLRFDTFSDFEAGLEIGAGANILIRKMKLVRPVRFELTTFCSGGMGRTLTP